MNPDPEQPFRLAQMAAPRRRTGLIVGIAALLIAVGAAATYAATRTGATPGAQAARPSEAAASPSPTVSPSPVVLSTSPAVKVSDEAALEACGRAHKATGDAAYDPKIVRPIGQRAGESAVPSVRVQGEQIVDLADAAAKSDDPMDKIKMATAVTNLSTYCLNNGLATAYG